jgi:Tetracyclin repressor-like, C-terminal domain
MVSDPTHSAGLLLRQEGRLKRPEDLGVERSRTRPTPRLSLPEQEAVRRSGLDQKQWMQTQLHIESVIENGRYPLLTRVVLDARAPRGPDRLKHGFDRGLKRVLDGLATMLPK